MPFLSDYYILMFFRVQELAFTLFHIYSKTTHSILILTPLFIVSLGSILVLNLNLISLIVPMAFSLTIPLPLKHQSQRDVYGDVSGVVHHHVVLPVPLYIDSSKEQKKYTTTGSSTF